MSVVTIGRLSEEILRILSGGQIQVSTNISISEIKISIGQVVNEMLKTEHLTINEAMGEKIPNGSVLGLYEGITYTQYGTGRSQATLPIKPLKLPRNMGVWSIFPSGQSDKEFIPLQMGQATLLKSQKLINDLMGQVGYEVFGMQVVFTKDLTQMYRNKALDMRLVIMDISQYDDYDPLPVLPEQEFLIKQKVVELYSKVGIADYLVDSSVKENQNVPTINQKQSP